MTSDPHQHAVYLAEHQALLDGGRRFARFAEIERYVGQVCAGPWWERRFPRAPIEVTVLRRSRGATFSAAHVTADGDEAAIWIRDGSWDAVTVVHELAHVATGNDHAGDGPHGAEFATTLLTCWRELLGVHAYGALRSAFGTNGIPFHQDRLDGTSRSE